MKKLSIIIATIVFFTGISVMNAQPGQGGGVPGHGGVNPPGHGETPPGLGGGGGSTSGNNNNEASHGVNIFIPTVTLVDVEGTDGETGTINLTPDVSTLEAGEAVKFSSANDNSLWLNYTSVVEKDQVRNIITEISGILPSGVSLKLSASTISTGKGKTGQPAGEISLTSTAQNLITGIGSCFTETGNGKGHQLKYILDMDNEKYADLMADNYEIKVTYTITD